MTTLDGAMSFDADADAAYLTLSDAGSSGLRRSPTVSRLTMTQPIDPSG